MKKQFWWEFDDFFSFLRWMANEKDFSSANEIIYVLENPWKYKKEWIEFKEEMLEEEEVTA